MKMNTVYVIIKHVVDCNCDSCDVEQPPWDSGKKSTCEEIGCCPDYCSYAIVHAIETDLQKAEELVVSNEDLTMDTYIVGESPPIGHAACG
jgi:hypothetical protein